MDFMGGKEGIKDRTKCKLETFAGTQSAVRLIEGEEGDGLCLTVLLCGFLSHAEI